MAENAFVRLGTLRSTADRLLSTEPLRMWVRANNVWHIPNASSRRCGFERALIDQLATRAMKPAGLRV
jgi:hypothetical protein